MKKTDSLLLAPIITGISLGFLIRFNVDISSLGIFKMMLDAMPFTEQNAWMISLFSVVLAALPLVAVAQYIRHYGPVGILYYCGFAGIVFLIFLLIT